MRNSPQRQFIITVPPGHTIGRGADGNDYEVPNIKLAEELLKRLEAGESICVYGNGWAVHCVSDDGTITSTTTTLRNHYIH